MGQNPSAEGDEHDAVVPVRSGRFRHHKAARGIQGDTAAGFDEGPVAGNGNGSGGISIRKKGGRFRRTDGTTSPSADDYFSELMGPRVCR